MEIFPAKFNARSCSIAFAGCREEEEELPISAPLGQVLSYDTVCNIVFLLRTKTQSQS